VGSASNFWDNTTESGMLVDTGSDFVNEQRVSANNSDPSFIAGGLDAKH
jgi:hypothetical protein